MRLLQCLLLEPCPTQHKSYGFGYGILSAMKNKSTLLIIVLFLGLLLANTAIFAATLGLDKNSGSWGRARILIFMIGVFLILCAGVYYFYSEQIEAIIRKFMRRSILWMEAHEYTARLLRFFRLYGFIFPIAIFVILVYVYFVSAGTWTEWISPTRYYADLERGFEHGKLFVPGFSPSELSELSDPYDPSARAAAGIRTPIDISYYNGRYYLYWGPVPSLILLAIRPITYGRVGDMQLVFGFVCGILLAQFFIIIFIWDRFFLHHPKWILTLSTILVGFSGPILYMLNNVKGSSVYDASIVGGQFLFISGLLLILVTLGRKTPSNWRLFLAGAFFALSIGSRLSLVIPVGVVTAISALWILKSKTELSQKTLSLFALALPLSLGAASLGWYNWERFGSITESGFYYQLAGIHIQKHYADLVKPIYIYQNLYNYFLNPFRLESQFPFAYVGYGNSQPIFPSYNLPALYTSQQLTGLFYLAPFVIFSIIPPLALLFASFRKSPAKSLLVVNHDDDHAYRWIILVLGASFLSTLAFLASFFWAAMRYIEDFMPSLVILSLIGIWQGYQMLADKPALKKYFIPFGLVLVIASIVMSVLIAISINNLRFAFIQ